MSKGRRSLIPFVVVALMLVSPSAMIFGQATATDNTLRAEIMNKALNKSKFKDVQVDVKQRRCEDDGHRGIWQHEAPG